MNTVVLGISVVLKLKKYWWWSRALWIVHFLIKIITEYGRMGQRHDHTQNRLRSEGWEKKISKRKGQKSQGMSAVRFMSLISEALPWSYTICVSICRSWDTEDFISIRPMRSRRGTHGSVRLNAISTARRTDHYSVSAFLDSKQPEEESRRTAIWECNTRIKKTYEKGKGHQFCDLWRDSSVHAGIIWKRTLEREVRRIDAQDRCWESPIPTCNFDIANIWNDLCKRFFVIWGNRKYRPRPAKLWTRTIFCTLLKRG